MAYEKDDHNKSMKKKCKRFIEKFMLRHANYFGDHDLQPNEVVILYDPVIRGIKVFQTDEHANVCEKSVKIYDDKYNTGDLSSHARWNAIYDFEERLTELNYKDDAEKAKFVHPIETGTVCHPLFCQACGVHQEYEVVQPFEKQKHMDGVLYDTRACDKCISGSEGARVSGELVIKLVTPTIKKARHSSMKSGRYYIDFSTGDAPKILDIRRVGDDGIITPDCYIAPSEMCGSSLFCIERGTNKYMCFVGNPLNEGLYQDFVDSSSGAGIYDRCGYPEVKFSSDKDVTDVLLLNKEVIVGQGLSCYPIMWGREDIRFHYLDLWNGKSQAFKKRNGKGKDFQICNDKSKNFKILIYGMTRRDKLLANIVQNIIKELVISHDPSRYNNQFEFSDNYYSIKHTTEGYSLISTTKKDNYPQDKVIATGKNVSDFVGYVFDLLFDYMLGYYDLRTPCENNEFFEKMFGCPVKIKLRSTDNEQVEYPCVQAKWEGVGDMDKEMTAKGFTHVDGNLWEIKL